MALFAVDMEISYTPYCTILVERCRYYVPGTSSLEIMQFLGPTYCVRIVAIFDISRYFTGTVLFYDDGLVKFSLSFHFGKDLRCLRGNISNGFRRISRSVQVYFSIPRSAKEVLFDIVFIM